MARACPRDVTKLLLAQADACDHLLRREILDEDRPPLPLRSHEGQLRAGLGQTEAATRLMMAGVNPEMSRSGFSDYALGTIAFLHQDRPGLMAARERLAALPKPAGFDQAAERYKATYGFDLEWPVNLKILDGFIACFDRPYDEAYGSCAAAAEKAAAGRH